ncbi:MAG TPA: glycosyltransferase family 39 protein [Myxococcota bacterium]|nr:glycosyltransferase family 39 protein [Myxococcota bacterium]
MRRDRPPAPPRPELSLAALLGALALVLVWRIGEPPAANPAESRVQEAVASIVSQGDWLVPEVDGAPRIEKPPGYAWLAAALSELAGGDSWATVRLPSAACAVAVAALLFVWGRSLGGPDLGLLAGLCFAAMSMTIDLGRRGVAEMALGLFCALALYAFDRVHYGGERRALPWFALWLALAILAKATTALLVVGLPIALVLALERKLGRAIRAETLGWLALALAAGFAWYGVVLAVVPGASRTLFAEAAVPVGVRPPGATATHYGPPYLYLPVLARAALPAVVLLPIAAVRAWRSGGYRSSPRLRFVAVAFAALFVAFSILPQKRTHYLVPLLPLLALLLAESVHDLRERMPEQLRRVLVAGAVVAVPLGLAASGALALFYTELAGLPQALAAALGAGVLVALAALCWSAVRFHPRLFAVLAGAGSLGLMLAFYGSVDVCRRQIEVGAAEKCADYDAARWEQAFQQWPALARFMAPAKERDS